MTVKRGMDVEDCQVLPLKARLIQPFRTALGQHDTLDNLLLVIRLGNGVAGYGEAAVATHITGETIEATAKNLRQCCKNLVGKNVGDYLNISAKLQEQMPENQAAVAAVEMAVFDGLTRSLNIPLWKLYGSRPAKIRTDITIVIDTLENTREKAAAFYQQGFRSFKIKIGRDMDLDLARVIAIAKIAQKSQLYLDANQGYSAEQTLRFLKQLEKYDIIPELVEQPVPKEDKAGLVKVTRLAKSKICADESVKSLADAVWAIKEKACDVINIKLMKCGLVQAHEIARLAMANNIGIMIGGMMESRLAMTCSAQIAAGLGFVEYVDLDTPFFLKDTRRHPFLSRNGVYDFTQAKSGIGIIP
ncbi:MAG: dipeptide epimerase [Candidatus Omnitrophica bacterium]|nr:dipeptide epimerase [Candidatus Omnitrophota bacterium]